MSNPQARTLLHRNYFIDLAQNADQNLVLTKITHSLTGASLLPPGFNYPDQALAEQYARAAIDTQLSAE
jgi:hypothetical protein